jgi:hypothetical protein
MMNESVAFLGVEPLDGTRLHDVGVGLLSVENHSTEFGQNPSVILRLSSNGRVEEMREIS